mgnify:CR=1 FL=1
MQHREQAALKVALQAKIVIENFAPFRQFGKLSLELFRLKNFGFERSFGKSFQKKLMATDLAHPTFALRIARLCKNMKSLIGDNEPQFFFIHPGEVQRVRIAPVAVMCISVANCMRRSRYDKQRPWLHFFLHPLNPITEHPHCLNRNRRGPLIVIYFVMPACSATAFAQRDVERGNSVRWQVLK